ncbi:hypothetical protein [Deinococcus misasensis]|uniref:hypothetical protein n=1 Tax=Deinococcus misasensis TaxID=392413 RepID=UPI0005533B4A|nr:hypothetical protein [Deinococcus misasensis]
MKKFLLALTLMLAPVAMAQTVAEMLVVTSIAATLDSKISVPKGTYGYTNVQYAMNFAKSLGNDSARYTDYQLYVATGITTKLAPAFVQQLETNFAAAGYFKTSGTTSGTTTRSEFTNDAGKILLLFTSYQKDAVYFLVGRKK